MPPSQPDEDHDKASCCNGSDATMLNAYASSTYAHNVMLARQQGQAQTSEVQAAHSGFKSAVNTAQPCLMKLSFQHHMSA